MSKHHAIALLVLAAGACALGRSGVDPNVVLRSAVDVPARFVLDPALPVQPGDTIPGAGCRSPLYDPRDRTQLRMVRSAEGRADYQPPSGRYGVREGELLRLLCNTGEALGIVRR